MSRTVRDLVVGFGSALREPGRGTSSKGIPDLWHIYALETN